MQASYRTITPGFVPKIKIIHNHLITKIDDSKRNPAKYKKVGKQTKAALLHSIAQGCSIISAAQILKINYSTAKSIVQMHKSKNHLKFKNRSPNDTNEDEIPLKEEKHLSQSRDDQLSPLVA